MINHVDRLRDAWGSIGECRKRESRAPEIRIGIRRLLKISIKALAKENATCKSIKYAEQPPCIAPGDMDIAVY